MLDGFLPNQSKHERELEQMLGRIQVEDSLRSVTCTV